MPAYRFCRPDDIPRIVEALEGCWRVHFPAAAPVTVESFRREMKELDVWPSNTMVAVEGDLPVGVVVGTKRAHEVLVHQLGVHPDHQRRGHGRHLVTSLSQKLAVLGPPRLAAEVPAALDGARAFFAAAGYREEGRYTDWLLPARPAGRAGSPGGAGQRALLDRLTVDDLVAAGALEAVPGAAWERTAETLANRRDQLAGLAVVSPERIEAWALYRSPPDAPVEIWGVGPVGRANEPQGRILVRLVLAAIVDLAETSDTGDIAGGRPVVLPRLAPGELPADLLAELGFAPDAETVRLGADAVPL